MPYGSSCSYTALHLSWMLAARLLAVGQRQKQVGELGVAVLIHRVWLRNSSRAGCTARR